MNKVRVGNKERPAVDPRSYELAEVFLQDYDAIGITSADSAVRLIDATWALADSIQKNIEGWLDDAVESHVLVEK